MNPMLLPLEIGRAAFNGWLASIQWTEMMLASASVIGARSGLIGAALASPADADVRELTRMVAEKQIALANSFQFWSREMSSMQRRWPHGPRTLAGGTAAASRLLAAHGEAMAPIHRTVTANARRLRKRRKN